MSNLCSALERKRIWPSYQSNTFLSFQKYCSAVERVDIYTQPFLFTFRTILNHFPVIKIGFHAKGVISMSTLAASDQFTSNLAFIIRMQPLLSLFSLFSLFYFLLLSFFNLHFVVRKKERLPFNVIVCYLEEFLFVKCFCDFI